MSSFDGNSFHRRSVAWQKSMQLAAKIYQLTETFPKEERFGLTNQVRRAAVSIPSNIAEGKGRANSGELAQFLAVARGSCLEVQTQLELAVILNFGRKADIEEAHELACEVTRILSASLLTLRERRAARKKQ